MVFGNGSKFFCQGRINLLNPLAHHLFQLHPHHFQSHRIELRHFAIQCSDDHSHRGSLNQQVQKVILLTQTQAFILQLLHHTVEDIYDTVRLILSHFTESATEILFAQQLHTTANDVHRFHDLTVEDNQKHQNKNNAPLHHIKMQWLYSFRQIDQHSA